MPQLQLPIFPSGMTPINPQIAALCESGKVAYLHGHLPVFQHDEKDLASFRLFTSQMIANGNVRHGEIVRAFGVALSTVQSAFLHSSLEWLDWERRSPRIVEM